MKRHLPTEMTHDRFSFRLLRREAMVAMFEKWKPNYHAGFEIVVLKAPGKPFVRVGQTITPVHETFPSSADWGKCAWTYKEKEPAERKFDRLLKRQARRG